jgi:hypothetical protein
MKKNEKKNKFEGTSKSRKITLSVSHEIYAEYKTAAKHMSDKVGMPLTIQDYLKLCSELAMHSITESIKKAEEQEQQRLEALKEETVVNTEETIHTPNTVSE